MKKKAYVPSKATSEKADAILKQMRIEQARSDLSKSNKKLGVIVPKSLDVSSSSSTSTSTEKAISKNKAKARSKKS